uniref:Uncharacterized protein n=1 Tax=Rhabditophanes sp. KR3021 TaxID=114890 RepID=A0AC35TMQ6_9BILA
MGSAFSSKIPEIVQEDEYSRQSNHGTPVAKMVDPRSPTIEVLRTPLSDDKSLNVQNTPKTRKEGITLRRKILENNVNNN